MTELRITRRHLPHWQIEGSIYFVTFRLKRREFLAAEERTLVLNHIQEGSNIFYDLFAVVVMPDHVHILLRPIRGHNLSEVMKGLKGVSAHKVNRLRGTKGHLWQDESYDRIVRDGDEFDRELLYIYENPLKKGLADEESPYTWLQIDVAKCGFGVPLFEDLLHADDEEL